MDVKNTMKIYCMTLMGNNTSCSIDLFVEIAVFAGADVLHAEIPAGVCLFVGIKDVLRVKNLFGLSEDLVHLVPKNSW